MKTPTKIALACTTVVVIGAVTAAGFAYAHDRKSGGHRSGGAAMLIEQIDADGDGALSQAEIDGFRSSRITQFDANQDGSLNLEEFQNAWSDTMRAQMASRFQRLDENGDAAISDAELQAPFTMIMSRLDRDDDGNLSADELKRMKRKHRGHRHGHDDDDDS